MTAPECGTAATRFLALMFLLVAVLLALILIPGSGDKAEPERSRCSSTASEQVLLNLPELRITNFEPWRTEPFRVHVVDTGSSKEIELFYDPECGGARKRSSFAGPEIPWPRDLGDSQLSDRDKRGRRARPAQLVCIASEAYASSGGFPDRLSRWVPRVYLAGRDSSGALVGIPMTAEVPTEILDLSVPPSLADVIFGALELRISRIGATTRFQWATLPDGLGSQPRWEGEAELLSSTLMKSDHQNGLSGLRSFLERMERSHPGQVVVTIIEACPKTRQIDLVRAVECGRGEAGFCFLPSARLMAEVDSIRLPELPDVASSCLDEDTEWTKRESLCIDQSGELRGLRSSRGESSLQKLLKDLPAVPVLIRADVRCKWGRCAEIASVVQESGRRVGFAFRAMHRTYLFERILWLANPWEGAADYSVMLRSGASVYDLVAKSDVLERRVCVKVPREMSVGEALRAIGRIRGMGATAVFVELP